MDHLTDTATAFDANHAPIASDTTPPAGAALPDTLTLTLRKPVTFIDQQITKIELREPRAGEMKQWANLTGVAASIAAVAIVSGLPEPVIGQLVARDIIAAGAFVDSFGLVSADAFDEPPAELTITLRYPIEHGEQRFTQIVLHEPTATQLIEWDRADGIAADLTIISAVSGVPLIALDKLGARDLVRAGSYLANFLVPGLSAGVR